MKMRILLLLSMSLALSTAEKLMKIENTSGEFSDIVADSKNIWYIVRDKTLYYSPDKGVTLNKIELPSKKNVFEGLAIDRYDNIYVQDNDLTVFVVAPTLEPSKFVFEEITLAYGKEKLVSRPFYRDIYDVTYFATKSGLMNLTTTALICQALKTFPISRKEITHMVHFDFHSYRSNAEGIYYSGGNPRNWICYTEYHDDKVITQTKSFVKYMNEGNETIYFIVNGEKVVRFIYYSTVGFVDKLDATIVNNQNFVIYSSTKTYIYGNVNNTGTINLLAEYSYSGTIPVMSTLKIENVRLLCSLRTGDEIFFGTSDGVYQLKDG